MDDNLTQHQAQTYDLLNQGIVQAYLVLMNKSMSNTFTNTGPSSSPVICTKGSFMLYKEAYAIAQTMGCLNDKDAVRIICELELNRSAN